MAKGLKSRIKKLIYLSIGFLIFLGGCREDNGSFLQKDDRKITFTAKVLGENDIKTRYDSVYISDKYRQNIYIQLCAETSPNQTRKMGLYTVPSGYEGKLDAIEGTEPLMWETLTDPHTFYAWTEPWTINSENTTDDNDLSQIKEIPDNIAESKEINFYDSGQGSEGYNKYNNNSIYETFIGAKSAEYSYNSHGKYVDLTFFHLVSKIRIGIFQLTQNSGAIQRHLQADMTFIGMPNKATFYPHPDNGRPKVEAPSEYDPDATLTYFIANTGTQTSEDIFYICPELDFNQIDFQIKLMPNDYTSAETYYGTFENVEFVRKNDPPEDFDSPNGNDEKILHAGEMMTININLIPGRGPGLAIVIEDWSTEDPQESIYHSYPGMYTYAEVKELLDAFLGQQMIDGKVTTEDVDRLFETYGVTDKYGNKYFNLYENVDISGNSDGNIFPVWKDYILNGLGHTITMRTNSFSNWFSGSPYFNLGPARDVYITSPDGNYSIYIDKDGYVWPYDKETNSYKQSEFQLTPLTEGNYSYNIDAKTGEVKQATYYNNQPGLND